MDATKNIEEIRVRNEVSSALQDVWGAFGGRQSASVGHLGKGKGTKAHLDSPRLALISERSSYGNCGTSTVIWKDSYNAVQIRAEGRIGTRDVQCLHIDLSIFCYLLVISISYKVIGDCIVIWDLVIY